MPIFKPEFVKSMSGCPLNVCRYSWSPEDESEDEDENFADLLAFSEVLPSGQTFLLTRLMSVSLVDKTQLNFQRTFMVLS